VDIVRMLANHWDRRSRFVIVAGHIDEPLGYLAKEEPDGRESNVPIFDQLFVGRECLGISPQRRFVIDDRGISRNHLEIRLAVATGQALVIDASTNGTLLNGLRLERAVPAPISDGDQLRIGDHTLTFRSTLFKSRRTVVADETETRISEAAMVMVVGDITRYSTISEVTDNRVIATSLNLLWQELVRILRIHHGTLSHYAGDALYAVWELRTHAQANELAVDFALAANRRVEELGPELPLRTPDGSPIRMGWGVAQGMAALAAMPRSVEAVIGDSTNVTFRLAGLAGRQGRQAVMVTKAVHNSVETSFVWGAPEQVTLKGRRERETVFPVIRRAEAGFPAASEPTKPPRRG
jgi:adenylate cyclase